MPSSKAKAVEARSALRPSPRPGGRDVRPSRRGGGGPRLRDRVPRARGRDHGTGADSDAPSTRPARRWASPSCTMLIERRYPISADA